MQTRMERQADIKFEIMVYINDKVLFLEQSIEFWSGLGLVPLIRSPAMLDNLYVQNIFSDNCHFNLSNIFFSSGISMWSLHCNHKCDSYEYWMSKNNYPWNCIAIVTNFRSPIFWNRFTPVKVRIYHKSCKDGAKSQLKF